MEPDDGYCQVVVYKAMEDPQPCGLETPCPTHSEPAPDICWAATHSAVACRGPVDMQSFAAMVDESGWEVDGTRQRVYLCRGHANQGTASIVDVGGEVSITATDPAPDSRSLRERGYTNANEYTSIYLGDRRDV